MKITENEFYIKSTYSKIDEGRKMSKSERERENGLEVNFSDCITMKKKSKILSHERTHQQVKSGYNVDSFSL